MLKADISARRPDGTRSVALRCTGGLGDHANDALTVINGIYSRLALSAEPGLAEEFRRLVTISVLDPVNGCFSRVHHGDAQSMSIIMPGGAEGHGGKEG